MIGRVVICHRASRVPGESGKVDTGTVLKWEPLSAAMTDALVQFQDGHQCWYGSHELQPGDSGGPLPSRAQAQAEATVRTLESLEAIREKLIADWGHPWPGAEFGKALVGKSLDLAIADLKNRRAP